MNVSVRSGCALIMKILLIIITFVLFTFIFVSVQSGCALIMKILLIIITFVLFTFVLGMPDKCDGTLDGESINKCEKLNQLSQESKNIRDTGTTCDCGNDGDVDKACCSPSELNKPPTPKSTSDQIKDIENVVEMCGGRCTEQTQNSVYSYLTRKVIPVLTSTTISDSAEFNYFSNRKLDGINSDETSYSETNYCGFDVSSENKVYGGNETAIDEYPWLAMLEYERPFLCGGTLISSFYVLTAAHCLVGETMKPRGVTSVRLGEYNTATDGRDCVKTDGGGLDCTDGAISITISDIIVHPEYNNVNSIIVQANDIGLLRLNESSPYTDFIRPICLPSFDVTRMNRSSDFRFHVAGWGAVSDNQQRSDVKLQVDLPIVDQKVCEKLYSVDKKPLIWKKQFCAGGESNKDTCKGDSGGPLIYSDEFTKIHHIVGITSFGILKCGSKGRPSIYTKVIEYVPWIIANMKPEIS